MAETPKELHIFKVGAKAPAELVRRIRDEILSELMASGGVTYDRAALEVLYYIPDSFREAYTKLFYQALANTDGGISQRGEVGAETGALGRAPGKAAGKTKQKRGTFPISDEQALEVKDRIDKRLRGIARDIQFSLDEIAATRVSTARDGSGVYERQQVDADIKAGNNGALREACSKCRKFVNSGWKFCAGCGNDLKE